MRQIIGSSRKTKTAIRQNLSAIAAAVVMLFSTVTYASANLIVNPDLETPNAGGTAPASWTGEAWGGASAAQFTYLNDGYNGSAHSGKITLGAVSAEGDAKWYFDDICVNTPTNACAGSSYVDSAKDYLFTDHYKSSVETHVVLQFTLPGVDQYYYADLDASVPAAADWAEESAIMTSAMIPANALSVTAFHLINVQGELTVDDFSLTEAPNNNPTIVDHVPNNGLEQARMDDATQPVGWVGSSWSDPVPGATVTPNFQYMNEGHESGHSVRLTLDTYQCETGATTCGDAKWVYDSQPLEAGKDYQFTAWYKTNTVPHVVAQFTDPSNPDAPIFFGMPNPEPPDQGWHQYVGQFTVPANATQVTVFMYLDKALGTDGQKSWVQTDDYHITPYTYQGFNRPLVTLTFDDGSEENVMTVLPTLHDYGFKTTQCYMTAPLENGDADDMDQVADLLAFAQDGHEICSHTVTHPMLSTLPQGDENTPGTLDYELAHSQAYLKQILSENGFVGQDVQNFASPYGDYSELVNQEIKKYYQSHRTVNEGYNSKNEGFNSFDNLDLYHLRVQNMLVGTTIDQYKDWIEKAIKDNTWLILVYHRVPCETNVAGCADFISQFGQPEAAGAFDTLKTDFDQQMAELKQYADVGTSDGKINVLTLEDAIAEVTHQIKPGTPAASPSPAGTYVSSVEVTLSTDDDNAQIRYTVDGTVPTCASPLYNGPFVLTASATVKALACDGSNTSDVSSFAYTVTAPETPTPQTPTASPDDSITYHAPIEVDLASVDSSFIRYTVDGSNPDCAEAGLPYLASIGLSESASVKAIACNGDKASEIATFNYAVDIPAPVYPELPTATPGSNTYTSAQNVTLSSVNSTSIHYTVDGTVPTCDTGLVYSGPVAVSNNLTLKAIGCNADGTSEVATFAYAFRTSSGNSGSHTGGGGGGNGGGSVAGASTDVHPNGTLIIDNGTVYLIKDNKRFGFRNAAEYQSYGYNFSQVVPATSADLQLSFDSANIMKAMPGTLVLDASDNKTVYMIGTGYTKRGFVSASVFAGLGYNFKNLPKINLADYPAGEPIGSASKAHPDGALVLDHGTVWWILGNSRQGFESAAVFNTYGFDWNKIVKANAADMALSAGSLVKFRDGTLVSDSGANYIISDGAARKFVTVSAMTTRGYNSSNVISASLANYTTGADLK